MQWILMHIFVVEYSTSYGFQCVCNSNEEKNYKITISNTKATLPFAIIIVLSSWAFVIDTRVHINWNENFRTRVFKFSALDRKFQNTSCSNAPKMVIFVKKMVSLVRTLCNQLLFQVERLLREDFLKIENYLIFEREVVSFYINRLRLPQ